MSPRAPSFLLLARLCSILTLILILMIGGFASAQGTETQSVPDPVPLPLPPREPPKDAETYESYAPRSSLPWGLPQDLLAELHEKVDLYLENAQRFVCDETARLAEYDGTGQATNEEVRRYAYVLTSRSKPPAVREYRSRLDKEGKPRPGDVDDREPFPPAYAWVLLFSRFHEPYVSFRKVGTYFDGFDLVHEIEFRGSVPFTDGRDVRQWEGRVLVDAFKYVPLEIQAEPANQKARVDEVYRNWAQAFNLFGLRLKAPPLAYRARVEFRYLRDALSYPTELRYDTLRAVSPTQIVPVRSSTRAYEKYLFTKVTPEETLGDRIPE